MKKISMVLIVLMLSCGVLSVFATVQAQSKLSVPEFTVKLVDNSYDVPPTQTTDPYTGTTTIPSYHVEKIEIEINIKNQNYPSKIEYQVRTKGHYEQEWNIRTTLIEQSKGQYTVITLRTEYLPDGAEIDIQVEARSGTYHEERDPASAGLPGGGKIQVFDGEKSGWSKTQTITINKNGNKIPTEQPDSPGASLDPDQQSGFSWVELVVITTIAVIIAVIATLFILRKQLTQKTVDAINKL